MKRIITIVLAIIMLFCTYGAIAETTEGAPILFRDIEWGVSLPEALKGMPEGARFKDMEPGTSYSMDGIMLDDSSKYFEGDVAGYVSAQSSSLEGIQIAGYELSGISMRFALVPGDDGMPVVDDEHTALYYAAYQINPKDLDAAYADLTDKLTSLYGEPTSTKETGYVIDMKFTTWEGAENTMLVLYSEKYSSGSTRIYIRYGTKDGDVWMQTAYDALVKEEMQKAASNVEGL